MSDRIYLYDSTLRDGSQAQDVDFTTVDKREVAILLDDLGIDYIEGGFPGANPKDDAFFSDLPDLKSSKIVAFGMTAKSGIKVSDDKGVRALLKSGVKSVCIFGKTWDFHVTNALEISLDENLKIIKDSVSYLKEKGCEVTFDAEHFFDGYKANPDYALNVLKTAYDAGARWVALCDTNGGTLPHEVGEIVKVVIEVIPGENLGIHCHNDTENAVANSLMAVHVGVRQVQGTIGGYGERCGNANLIAIIPTLVLKMGYKTGITEEGMKRLTQISNALDDKLNRARYPHAAYVGSSAFAHKGGVHASAVAKNSSAYEHVSPDIVGNENIIVISDQAGKANVISKLESLGIEFNSSDSGSKQKIIDLVHEIKRREKLGYAYDSADASFEILARRSLGEVLEYYDLRSFRVIDERRWNARGELVTFSEAKVKFFEEGREIIEIAEGNGPVNALSKALKKWLGRKYHQLEDINLVDYKVRIMQSERGTGAITRVQIKSSDSNGNHWTTVGVSANIIDASYNALCDSFIYKLLHS